MTQQVCRCALVYRDLPVATVRMQDSAVDDPGATAADKLAEIDSGPVGECERRHDFYGRQLLYPRLFRAATSPLDHLHKFRVMQLLV
jgi:hypothetical protein